MGPNSYTPSQLSNLYGGGAVPPAMGPPRPPMPPMPPLMSNGLPSPPTAPLTAYQTGQSVGRNIVRPAVNAVAGTVGKVARGVGRVGKAGLALAPAIGALNTVDRFSNQNSGAENVIANAGFDGNQTLSPLQFAGATSASLLRDTGNAATFGLADWAGGKLGGKLGDMFSDDSAALAQPLPRGQQAQLPTQPGQPSPSPQLDTAQPANPTLLPSPQQDAMRRQGAVGGTVLQPKPIEPNASEITDLSNLGQRVAFDGQAAAGGYSPIADNTAAQATSGMPITVRTGANGATEYLTPKGTISFSGQGGSSAVKNSGVLGAKTRKGGGTLSVQDQGNGETIEGNVARLNSQIEALRGLREARNPGITTGGNGGGLPSAPTMDVFARPGDGWGDSEMRAEQYRGMMNQAGTGRGMTRNQRAAMAAGAQGLIAPGLAQIQQQGNMYGQQLDAYGRQQAANQALQQQDRAYGIDQRKADLNEQKAQQQYRLDQMNAEGNQAYRKAGTQEAQLRARGLAEQQNLMQKYQEMYKKNPNDTEALDYIRSLILMSQRRNEPAEPAQSELDKMAQRFDQQKAAQASP
jgi:hypothetical protein